jgi:ribosomal protein L40E
LKKLSFWGKFHTVLFSLVAFLAVASHFYAMTTDPGAVPPDAEPLPEINGLDITRQGSHDASTLDSLVSGGVGIGGGVGGGGGGTASGNVMGSSSSNSSSNNRPKKICRRCKSFKPDRAHHCSICNRCILKMDHHCPWVNNCVGIGNHKFFLLFVFYTFCTCVYAIGLVVARFVNCLGSIEKHEPCLDEPTHLLGLIGLMVESLLFGMFTCCMVIDQWDVVVSNVTHIDRLKGEIFMEDVEGRSGIHEVFGSGVGKGKKVGFRLDWLSPFAKVCFPEHVEADIMGFCRPCSRFSKVKGEDVLADVMMSPSAFSATAVSGDIV